MRLGIFTTFHWIKIPSCGRPPRSRPLPSHPHHHAKTPREKHSARRFASIQQKDQLAARRLTLDSASTVSFLSVAGQLSALTSAPCIRNTSSRRCTCVLVSSRWLKKPCLSCLSVAFSAIF